MSKSKEPLVPELEKSEGQYKHNIFSDTTDRHPIDYLIRSHGWRIYSRKKKNPATWEKHGKVLSQTEVLNLIKKANPL